MKYIKTFALAILAGLAIGVGGCVYLSLENKIVGALLFTTGLYTIVTQGLWLFTGKIGYLVNEKPAYLIELLVGWLGNLTGTYLAALCLSFTRVGEKIGTAAAGLCEVKLADGMGSLFLLGIFCGMLMFIAVDGYKKTQNPIILFVCVATFILCGFEHCIADMVYFSMAGMWSGRAFLEILVITLGNSLGGMLLPGAAKIRS